MRVQLYAAAGACLLVGCAAVCKHHSTAQQLGTSGTNAELLEHQRHLQTRLSACLLGWEKNRDQIVRLGFVVLP